MLMNIPERKVPESVEDVIEGIRGLILRYEGAVANDVNIQNLKNEVEDYIDWCERYGFIINKASMEIVTTTDKKIAVLIRTN